MSFIKKQEDFMCENCNMEIEGNGFTNHCPFCLWSKHVDIKPGDRAAKCGGTMKPLQIMGTGDEMKILHECILCKYQKPNKISPNDSQESILEVTRKFVEKELYS